MLSGPRQVGCAAWSYAYVALVSPQVCCLSAQQPACTAVCSLVQFVGLYRCCTPAVCAALLPQQSVCDSVLPVINQVSCARVPCSCLGKVRSAVRAALRLMGLGLEQHQGLNAYEPLSLKWTTAACLAWVLSCKLCVCGSFVTVCMLFCICAMC